MALDVEAIWTALTERLRERVAGIKDFARRPRHQYTTQELPVVIVRDDEGQEELISDEDDPGPVWRLTGEIQIHARTGDLDASPTTQLNDLIKATRTALEFDPSLDPYQGRISHYTTLGGRVRVLAVQKVEKGMGALTGQPMAVITLTMEAQG